MNSWKNQSQHSLFPHFQPTNICYICFRVCRLNRVKSVHTLLHVLWLRCQQLQGKSEGVCGFSARVWHVCVCVWTSTARCATSLPGLVYFLVAGAAVRSLPGSSSPTVFVSVDSSSFLFTWRRKQDEHPGQEWSHKVWSSGRKMWWPWKWKRGQPIHRHQKTFGLLRLFVMLFLNIGNFFFN